MTPEEQIAELTAKIDGMISELISLKTQLALLPSKIKSSSSTSGASSSDPTRTKALRKFWDSRKSVVLTEGEWIVALDIAPGKYNAMLANTDSDYACIEVESVDVDKYLCSDEDSGSDWYEITPEKPNCYVELFYGDTVKIEDSSVKFVFVSSTKRRRSNF